MALKFQFHPNSPQSALHLLVSPSSHCILQFQFHLFHRIRPLGYFPSSPTPLSLNSSPPAKFIGVRCSEKPIGKILRTCRNCKTQFDPSLNHPRACCFHTAHFGGETKRKFESVYTGGTMNTPNSGQVLEYWHCCGSEDPFDPGCTAAPHASYDD